MPTRSDEQGYSGPKELGARCGKMVIILTNGRDAIDTAANVKIVAISPKPNGQSRGM